MSHIAVVGNGPAAWECARLLAIGGCRVTVVAGGSERDCGLGVLPRRVRQDAGLPDTLVSATFKDAAGVSPSGRTAYRALPWGPWEVVSRAELRRDRQAAALAAGAAPLFVRCVGFAPGDGDYPWLMLETGETLACDAVVAADGPVSMVARALGLPDCPLALYFQARLETAEAAGEAGAQFHLGRKISPTHGGYVLPTAHGAVVGVVVEARYGKRSRALLETLAGRLPSPLREAAAGPFESGVFPEGLRERLAVDRVLLIGPAAGCPPGVGDRLAWELDSAALAAETLASHRHLPTPERLAAYEEAVRQRWSAYAGAAGRLMGSLGRSERGREAAFDGFADPTLGRMLLTAHAAKRPPGGGRWAPAALFALKLAACRLRQALADPRRYRPEPLHLPPDRGDYVAALAGRARTGPLRARQPGA